MEETKPTQAPKKKAAPKKKKAPTKKKGKVASEPAYPLNPHTKLSIDQWHCLWLTLAGQTVKQIASTLNISEQTIYSWQTRNEPAAINYREALAEEVRVRNDFAREKAQTIVVKFYDVLDAWVDKLKKQKGSLDPKHVANIVAILNASKWMFKNETKTDEDDKKKAALINAFEQFIKEEITNQQISMGE